MIGLKKKLQGHRENGNQLKVALLSTKHINIAILISRTIFSF